MQKAPGLFPEAFEEFDKSLYLLAVLSKQVRFVDAQVVVDATVISPRAVIV